MSELSYGTVLIYNDETLGIGSYGKVCKAKCGQLPCAAKLLHETMFDTNDPGIGQYVEKFEQECQFLRMIKHPNIIQYLGISRDLQSGRLGLLMELMDESLTRFLERSTGPLPYHTQLDIVYDVALALAYLHSNDIIHRDLSSNNVLLIGEGSRAKVTDFGMSKLIGMSPHMTPLTTCPGTAVYMPPEALITPPQYSSKLDCFSHGVLIIQIATKQFPKPGDVTTTILDKRYPTGRIVVFVPETERRKKDIDLIEPTHPLVPLALHCLKDLDTERPSADEVCVRLASLKSEAEYTHSVDQSREWITSSQRLQQQIQQKEGELARVREEYEEALQKCKDEIAVKEQVIAECHVALRASSEHYEKKMAEIYKEKHELPKVVAPIDVKQESTVTSEASSQVSVVPAKLTWRRGEPAPGTMTSYRGTAIGHGNTAYFSQDHNVYSYTVTEDKWTSLKPCDYKYFSMAVVNDKLTTIGGQGRGDSATNILLCLSGSSSDMKWEILLPPMPTERERPAVVTTYTHLVVAGGGTRLVAGLSTVEVLNFQTLQWASASNSPKALENPNMTICDGQLYLSEDKTIFSCSVEELLNGTIVWNKQTDIPLPHGASLATLGRHMLAIGGSDGSVKSTPTGAIYYYNKRSDSWRVSGEIPTPRYATLVAVLPTNELVVVGGCDRPLHVSRFAEIAKIADLS